jgi:hypothetical protein
MGFALMSSKYRPEEERLAIYRQQAEQALRQAAVTPDAGIRNGFLKLAAAWQELIRAAEGPLPGEKIESQPEKLRA